MDAKFRSVFIANQAAGLKPFSAKRPAATQGQALCLRLRELHLRPLDAPILPGSGGGDPKDFASGRPGFSGSHDATIALVQSGAYQAGALNGQVWDSRLKEGKVDTNKVVLLWRTPPYADYHWIAQGNLDQRFGAGFTSKLQQSLLT